MQFLSNDAAVGPSSSSLYRRHSSRLRRLCRSIKSRGRGGREAEGEGNGDDAKRSPYADLISLDHARKIQVRFDFSAESIYKKVPIAQSRINSFHDSLDPFMFFCSVGIIMVGINSALHY